MLTSKAVIQCIDPATSSVRLFQNFDLRSSWSFDTRRASPASGSNRAIFPFEFHGGEHFQEGRAGHETKVQAPADGRLLFADDYGVPAGFMIAVLFPHGYSPDVFKFKAKPFIPTGVGLTGASIGPPGHFEVFANQAAQRCAVVFLITQPTFFGFKCIASTKKENFPNATESPFLSDLYAPLGFAESHPTIISADELHAYRDQFKAGTDLQEIGEKVNRLLALVESGSYEGTSEAHSITASLQQALGNVASAVQLSDSFITGGTVAKLLAYLAL
jgi:hypothetical protein